MEKKMKKMTKKIGLVVLVLLVTGLGACASDPADDGDNGPTDDPIEIDPANMVDDLEDGDDAIITTDERSGDWYTFNDATSGEQSPDPDGNFSPEEGGPEGSSYAVHTTGNGWTEWGAGLGLDLNGADPADPDASKGVFDVSGFEGMAFWAKGDATLWVMLATYDVIAEDEGGGCVAGSGDGEACDNAHGKSVSLTGEWGQYLIKFEDLAQEEGWGQQIDFDPANLTSLMFQTGPGETFDYWIDEIGFY